MPVEVIKYTCEFKCGQKALSEKSRIKGHESSCWKNPANQTCKTCSNEIYVRDGDGYRDWISRGCKINSLDDVFSNVEEILKHQNNFHIRPIYKCPYWNKEDDGNSNQFAELLEVEIKSETEGTEHYPFFNKPAKMEV